MWGRTSKGEKAQDPVRVEGAWPALISRELFDAVQEAMRDRAPKVQRPARVGSKFLLSGLLKCGVCGRPYRAQGAKSGQCAYYICGTLFTEGAGTCSARYMNAPRLEAFVVEKIRQRILTEETIVALVTMVAEEIDAMAGELVGRLEVVEAELGDVRKRLERHYEALETSELAPEVLSPRILSLKHREEQLEAARDDAERQLEQRRVELPNTEGIMDAEVSSRIGAEYGERSPERVTQRNGYRSRAWDTRVGTMDLHIPKLREGSYFPSLLEPRRRSERALLAVIQQAYVEGVSTRRVDDLVKALGCEGISKSQVSRICQELDVVMDGFLGRPLGGGPYPYLWLDALTQKVREDGRIVNVSVVVATAVNGEGKREIIGMDVGTSEDGAFWLAFLRSLSARGLGGVELVVSDAHQGLRGAIAAVFGGASWQRCRTHFMTNLLTRVPRRAQPWVATMVRTIYQQPSPDEVHAQLDRVTDQLRNRFPQVASLLDEAGPDVLAFSNFPLAHWKKIWSNNPQERLNKEIRRRTDVVGIFPNRPAVRRLVGAVLAEQHDEWAVGRRYITPVVLTLNEALPEADLAEATAA